MKDLHADDTPRPGDIVVRKQVDSGNFCILTPFQGESQLVFHIYDDAIRHAEAYAVKDRVDVWFTENGETYRRLAGHRQEHRPQQSQPTGGIVSRPEARKVPPRPSGKS
jgi:hypothetical protein